MVDWRQYDDLLTRGGDTAKDRNLEYLRDEFERSVFDNPGYEADARRNGEKQRMLFSRSGVRYKMNVVVFPGEELYVGDLIDAYGEKWICVETIVMNSVQVTGLLWLCNYEFAWQNFTPDIIKCWGVLDAGVYSTTKNGDEQLQYLDKQYKVFLPYNEDTQKLFIDKRIATGTAYDGFGEQILTVYSITGVDQTSRSYGHGGHLLVLNLRSSAYNASKDDFEHRICDYIVSDAIEEGSDELLNCEIEGKTTIIKGKTRTYIAKFYDSVGSVTAEPTPSWQVLDPPAGITSSIEDGVLTVAADKAVYVGTTFQIRLVDTGAHYNPCVFDVEVKAYG